MGCTTTERSTEEDRVEAERWRPLVWCPNSRCEHHEKTSGDNITFTRRYGKAATQLQYRCNACGQRFSLRKFTPYYRTRLPEETFDRIVVCLGEGNGIRATARIVGVKTAAVERVQEIVGEHVQRLFNYFLRDLSPNEVQVDELWSFLRKKERHLTDLDALHREWGDCWVWVAFDPETKVVLGFVLGKRTKDRAVRLLKRVHEVLEEGHFPLFTSDELSSYEDAIVQVFGVTVQPERKGDRGRFPNPRRVPHPDLAHAVVHKHRKNNRIVKVERRTVTGEEADIARRLEHSSVSTKVNTSGVERENGKLRAGQGRLRRKTLGFAKEKMMLLTGILLTLAYDHFCRPHLGLRKRKQGRPPERPGLRKWMHRTPMMALGKTNHVWDVRELLLTRYPGRNARCNFGGL